jgi:hypothetical protein
MTETTTTPSNPYKSWGHRHAWATGFEDGLAGREANEVNYGPRRPGRAYYKGFDNGARLRKEA